MRFFFLISLVCSPSALYQVNSCSSLVVSILSASRKISLSIIIDDAGLKGVEDEFIESIVMSAG